MPKKASVDDLRQMFDNSTIIYKNKPYYVHGVKGDYTARCTNLLTQRDELLEVNEEVFTAPSQRLGYVNVHGGVVYCTRTAIRRYKTGLSTENLSVKVFDGYDDGAAHAKAHIQSLRSVELGDCILGKYPTIPECWERIKKLGHNTVAFDRQFAISAAGYVYYKGTCVGHFKRTPKGVEDLNFDPEYTHLHTLLNGNYEKALSAPRS